MIKEVQREIVIVIFLKILKIIVCYSTCNYRI